MVKCQLEELPQKVVIAGALPIVDDGRLWFGAVNQEVVRVEVEMSQGENLKVGLATPTDAAFKVFAIGLSRDQARLMKHCTFLNAAGQDVKQLKEEDVIQDG